MPFRSVDELRTDALFRAGEPQDSTSSFWTKSIEYLTRVQHQLVLGGGVSVGRDLATSAGIYAHLVDLPITDWWWIRKQGVLTTVPDYEQPLAGSLTQGSQTATLSQAVPESLTGWFCVVPGQGTVLRIQQHDPGSTALTFDGAWPEATLSAPTVHLAKLEYDLPPDFVRFATPPYVHSYFGSILNVGTTEQRFTDAPFALLYKGQPTRSFLIGPQRIALNTYDSRPYRLEYEYVAMPNDLVSGGIPIVPVQYRQVLSVGAAMLICFDKGDSRMQELASEYRELVRRMAQDQRRMLTGGSTTFGVHKVRGRPLRLRPPQQFGEMFVI